MTDTQMDPGHESPFRDRYENYINGHWVAPADGEYFENVSPIYGRPCCLVARSTDRDIELALDAAHAARENWGRTAPAKRAQILNLIADRMETNSHLLASVETWENGKPLRETLLADLPLAIDHFRYFAGCLRADEGSLAEINYDTIAYHFKEPLGVVGQIIPWNYPLLMAAWKVAPALAAGNCIVLRGRLRKRKKSYDKAWTNQHTWGFSGSSCRLVRRSDHSRNSPVLAT